MRNRVAVLTAIVVFALLVAGLAVLADNAGDKSADGLPRLRYASGAGERNAMASDAAGAPDIALYPQDVEYRLARPLDKPADEATAYRITRPSKADADRLARALGIGALRTEGEAWTAGGDAKQLRVESETGWWSYGPGPDTAVSSDGGREPAAPDKGSVGECAPCPPGQICTMECRPVRARPALPSKDDAAAAARAFWDKTGIDPGDAELEVTEGYDDVQVGFGQRVDGREVLGPQTSVAVDAKKQIRHASGRLGGHDAIGDYPLIDLADAVKRLNQPASGRPVTSDGTPPPGAEPMPAQDLPANAGTDSASPNSAGSPEPDRPVDGGAGAGTTGSTGSAGSSGSAGGAGSSSQGSAGGSSRGSAGGSTQPSKPDSPPVTIGPTPAPDQPVTPTVVTIVGVRLAYEFTGTHLLPVYVFETEGGGRTSPVPAVPDSLLAPPHQAERLTD